MACKINFSVLEHDLIACTLGELIISVKVLFIISMVISLALAASAISVARLHKDRALLASPDTAATFLKNNDFHDHFQIA